MGRNVCKVISRMRFTVCCILLMLHTANGFSAEKTDDISTTKEMFCPDLTPQGDLDLEQIMGEWYVVEIVRHAVSLHPTASGHTVLKTCPSVDIRFSSRSSLRLLWTEKVGNLEYFFIVPDVFDAPGFWVSRGLQNGTLLLKNYVQFRGTVQVMKAVATHMVLTFCANTPDNDKYSILLSRERDLPDDDSTGVRNLLSRRGLTIASIQETCTNGGNRKESSNVTRWTTIVVAAVTAALLAAASTTTTTTINSFVI